jgi:hypothetical protein
VTAPQAQAAPERQEAPDLQKASDPQAIAQAILDGFDGHYARFRFAA